MKRSCENSHSLEVFSLESISTHCSQQCSRRREKNTVQLELCTLLSGSDEKERPKRKAKSLFLRDSKRARGSLLRPGVFKQPSNSKPAETQTGVKALIWILEQPSVLYTSLAGSLSIIY